ncbi:MAG: putative selenium-dependent hydroxylase accessory protein YqeC [Phycisphaerales bacterium]|nr:MAG: putative selenium-dependent hydroxylase accessory protein YqeC [Phycisphaerales bacterium]
MTFARFPMQILKDVFALVNHRYVFFVGGGGKTTLMFTLAQHLSRAGSTVISTTSTKILHPPQAVASRVMIEEDPARVVWRLRSELPGAGHITIGKSLDCAENKLRGYGPGELDYLRQADIADYMLVEADGAAGRSLKAHQDYEPVVSPRADLVIAVIGVDCIGRLLGDADVHRAERFGALLNRAAGTPIRVEDVAAIFFHPFGYLKAVPPEADVIVFISKVAARQQRANALRLAAALRAADRGGRISRIVIGELTGAERFVESAFG